VINLTTWSGDFTTSGDDGGAASGAFGAARCLLMQVVENAIADGGGRSNPAPVGDRLAGARARAPAPPIPQFGGRSGTRMWFRSSDVVPELGGGTRSSKALVR
jgi:hypothetical protein